MTRNRRLPLVLTAALLALATSACSSPAGASTAGPATSQATSPATTAAAPAITGSAGQSGLPAAAKDGITLRVTGPGAMPAHVSYTVDSTPTEVEDATVPWQRTVTPTGDVTSISLTAMSVQSGDLTCEILIDGERVHTRTADASTGGVAHCDWTAEDE